ncbi:class I SAM-dependent methyltransferase [Accumulibacter sp.]|uniref:class I SAM-dependent methyltransferase n=1 Tax=Accumulibacter sp. TaxID=2053492 RepID=UPI001AD0D33B|nr:class I SAM-dependent methyltransferase [Accumulibacter sp.]MBN8454232.1 class I SAM-dependent methyltransferase [Accumulibacter sp.]MBO3707162.1 class I SAM-dependent methyltransferase [Candidatus Accumulibacter conexus]
MKRVNSQIHTEKNRYPLLFGNAYYLRRKYQGSRIKILSFGCSTGDELMTLAAYFPGDRIYGCDINPEALAAARELTQQSDISVFESNRANLEKYGPFDIIFANSVLCINAPNPALLRAEFPFSKFEQLAVQLARLLTADGMLFLFNTSYFPEDSDELFSVVKPVRSHFISMGYVPRFDRDSNLLLERQIVDKRGFYYTRSAQKLSFAAVADVIFSRSEVIVGEDLDYSSFNGWHESGVGISPPAALKAASGSVVWEKTVWHYLADESRLDMNIRPDSAAQLGTKFLPQIFYRLPQAARGFVPLSHY